MIKEASDTAESVDRRTKIQALSLAKDVYAMKMELLTNATIADYAWTTPAIPITGLHIYANRGS